jgi:hypothetical protein
MKNKDKYTSSPSKQVTLKEAIVLSGKGGLRLMFKMLIYPERPLFIGSFREYLKQGRCVLQAVYGLRAIFFVIKRGFVFDVIHVDEKSKHNANVIDHNFWTKFGIFRFSRRAETLLYLLLAADANKQGKTLCIGPKNEGEPLLFRAHGFKDVIGIDLFTYTPTILVMDIHQMTFPDNTFDTVNCGWVLRYCYDLPKAINEIIRVSKNGALIACSITWSDGTSYSSGNACDIQGIISLFGEHVEHVFWRDDIDQIRRPKTRLVLQLKK